MTTNRVVVNPRMLATLVIAASLLVVTIGSQNAMAQPSAREDVVVEELVEAGGNATMTAPENETADGNLTGVEFLGIQNAQSGSISPINATAYTLELNEVSDKTILFSDRPDRIVKSITTADFVGNWTAGQDSFAADAPNAALVINDIQTGGLDTAVIELFNSVYDTTTDTLTYTIIAENATSIALPSEFGQSILVIDTYWFQPYT